MGVYTYSRVDVSIVVEGAICYIDDIWRDDSTDDTKDPVNLAGRDE